jgi:hypothetical protein
MNDSKTTSMKLLRLGLILGATALGAFAQSHSIDWHKIDGGSGTSGLDSVSAPSASHGSLSDLVQPGGWGWSGGLEGWDHGVKFARAIPPIAFTGFSTAPGA